MENCIYEEISSEITTKQKDSAVYFLRQLLVSSGVWLSFFSFGLATGSCTVVIPQLRREANSTEAVSESMASWITAGNNYGAFTSLIFTSIMSVYVGRKVIFLIASAVTIAANILFYFSTNNVHLLISEIMQGVNGACLLTVDLMIIVEYSSPKNRGVFLNIKTAMMFWGIWASNAIGTFFHWRNIALLGIVCSIYTFVTSVFWPESPFWLASKGRFEECARSYRWLRGKYKNSEKELDILLKTNDIRDKEAHDESKASFLKKMIQVMRSISKVEFYKPTLICILIICMYHATGKLIISVYAIEIIKKIIKDERTAYITMLFLDGITVLGMYIGCGVSKFVRRRILFLTCSFVGVLCLFIISGYLYLVHLSVFKENTYLSIALLTIFSLAISAGPIVLSSSLVGEIAPFKLRSLSFFIIVFINYCTMGNIVKVAPTMFATLRIHGAILMYGILSSFFLYLVYKYLPETKDKTLHEIKELIIKSNRSNCKFMTKS